jgi:uncharacterized protein YkwD
MRRLVVLLLGPGLIAAGLVTSPVRASAQSDAVEVRVLELINQGRAGQSRKAEIMHGGLRVAARNHSANMSARNSMDHSGYPGRISTAAPDPAESNGAPDDGFNGYSCENVAWYQPGTTATTEQLAQKFYSLWYNSSPHRNCMFDATNTGFNVAGVGIYSANGKWWATFDSAIDRTPPTGSSTTPPPTPTGTWKRVDQSATGTSYWGTWYTASNSRMSGGSYRYSGTNGATAKFTFTGTGVRWVGASASSGGIANVKVDGVLVGTVDQYSASTVYIKTMFERTGLTRTTHVLEVSVSGKRNAGSSGYWAFVDAFDFFS